MKSLVLFFCLSFGTAVTAHADTIPGFYEKLKNRFENATTAPSMNDIPSLENHSALACNIAYKDDSISPTRIFKISKTVSAGPLEPPKVTEKVILAWHFTNEIVQSLINLITQRVSQDADGKTTLVVNVEETPYYLSSPIQFEIRKSDYIYIKVTQKEHPVYYAYCYPSEKTR